MDSIGYIGLGIMGSGMARNLLAKGFDLTVWNRTPEKMTPLVEAGATAAASPADLAERSDVVLVCVSDTTDVEQVVLGDNGIIHGLRPGSVVVDHSTISPKATVALAEAVRTRGGWWLDAPVSGGSEGAARGALAIMIGGDADVVARVRPILEAYGSSINHVGPTGSGQQTKLVNQILVVINGYAVSEALIFAKAAGLDLARVVEAVAGGAAGSWMLSNRGPQMIERDWRPGFTIDLQQKDLRLALETADELGVPVIGTGYVFQLYRTLQAHGLGLEGNHALVKAIEALSGIEL